MAGQQNCKVRPQNFQQQLLGEKKGRRWGSDEVTIIHSRPACPPTNPVPYLGRADGALGSWQEEAEEEEERPGFHCVLGYPADRLPWSRKEG